MAGQHRIKYDDGDLYEGEWSAEGKRHGKGVLTFTSGVCYSGDFVGGFFQGRGVLKFSDGARYEGNFEVGKYHGYGVYTASNGMKYEVRRVYMSYALPNIVCLTHNFSYTSKH